MKDRLSPNTFWLGKLSDSLFQAKISGLLSQDITPKIFKAGGTADARKCLERGSLKSFGKAIAKNAKKDCKLRLVGFGTFSLTKRKVRKGRNPKTGQEITIKASKSVKSGDARISKRPYSIAYPPVSLY